MTIEGESKPGGTGDSSIDVLITQTDRQPVIVGRGDDPEFAVDIEVIHATQATRGIRLVQTTGEAPAIVEPQFAAKGGVVGTLGHALHLVLGEPVEQSRFAVDDSMCWKGKEKKKEAGQNRSREGQIVSHGRLPNCEGCPTAGSDSTGTE